jgi:Ca-activated chloride channel family protein
MFARVRSTWALGLLLAALALNASAGARLHELPSTGNVSDRYGPACLPHQEPTPQKTPTPVTEAQPAAPGAVEGSPQDDEHIVVHTDLTNIFLTAIGKDKRFVTTLKADDIKVSEDGKPQPVEIFQRETDLPLSVAILIDTSKSEERSLPDEKKAARQFVKSLVHDGVRGGKDSVAVISFTGIPTMEEPPTNDVPSLVSAIDRVQIVLPPDKAELKLAKAKEPDADWDDRGDPRGATAIWDSMFLTCSHVLSRAPMNTRRAIILLTDGDDTFSRVRRKEAIDVAVKTNAAVYAIGIGDPKHYDIDKDALREVTEGTGGRAFFPKKETDLDAAFTQIEQELRSQYLIAYHPTNKSHDGSYRHVRVEIVNKEVRKQKLFLLYRQGYFARQQQAKAPSAER